MFCNSITLHLVSPQHIFPNMVNFQCWCNGLIQLDIAQHYELLGPWAYRLTFSEETSARFWGHNMIGYHIMQSWGSIFTLSLSDPDTWPIIWTCPDTWHSWCCQILNAWLSTHCICCFCGHILFKHFCLKHVYEELTVC